MRKIVVSAVCSCLMSAGSAGASGPTAEDLAALTAVSDAWAAAANANDTEAIAALYSEDAFLAPPNAPLLQGRQRIQAFFSSGPRFSDVTLENVHIQVSGDLAYVCGIYSLTARFPEGDPFEDTGKYLDVRRRQADGSWLIVADAYNSSVPVPADE